MATAGQIERCFAKPVIPVLWEIGDHAELLRHASCVILQGGPIAELTTTIERFMQPPLDHLRLFVHVDLVAGLETSEAGLELLAQIGSIDGIVSVHQNLAKPAKRLGMLSLLRIFLSDSRALERGLKIASKSHPDVVEFLPAAAAVKVADDVGGLKLPFICGGLCRTETDVRETLACGCRAVTSTRPALWALNADP